MKKDFQFLRSKYRLAGILFSVFVVAVLTLTACQPQTITNTGSSPTAAPSPSAGSQTQPPAASQTVSLANSSFNPKQLTVPVGTTVVWMNNDTMAHTVTADDQSFDSGNLNSGDSFKFTFTKAGTYAYHCKYHGAPNGVGMSGQIVVTEK